LPGLERSDDVFVLDLGDTGDLHFQLMNGPSILQADGLPYVLDGFTYEGQVPPEVVVAADDDLSGTFFPGKLPAGQPRTDQLPLGLALVGLPG
jgi:hypothetical protein